VLAAAGEKFFCAGMDLKEAGQPESPGARRDRFKRSRDVDQLGSLSQPTIAAINGYALGGGFEMALACDFRVMADTATVGLPEINAGLGPAAGGTQRLPRLIGIARATELIMLGRRLGADEALAYGLVNRVVPLDQLHQEAGALAGELAGKSPRALRDAEIDAISTLLAEQQATKEA
jgi:enoyl-CoA hydratase/carnithine racemase